MARRWCALAGSAMSGVNLDVTCEGNGGMSQPTTCACCILNRERLEHTDAMIRDVLPKDFCPR
jgi:hypothetical protein